MQNSEKIKMIYKTLFNTLIILISLCGFIFAFVTGGQLVSFLSSIPSNVEATETKGTSTTIWALTINISLLCTFMFQHSAMAKPLFKRAVYSSGFQVVERSIYVIMTAIALQCLMTFWQPIYWVKIWDIDSSGTVLWTFFTAVHCLAWIIIYVGTLMMDIAEILGVKQVYYKLRGLPDPITFKSQELQRFYLHMRHPSFTGFCILLWFYPVMSIDRLLLAGLWTIYMMVAWNVDHFDHLYQSQQLKRKQFEMEHPKMTHQY